MVDDVPPTANDYNLTVNTNPNQPITGKLPSGTFTHVDSETTYKVCAVGATSSSQCQDTVDGMSASANPDGSVQISGQSPAVVGTTVHSIIAVNEFGASQPSPDNGARVTVVTASQAPTVKDYTATETYSAQQNFSVKAIPVGIFSNVNGSTHYQICPIEDNGEIEPCEDSYLLHGHAYYASANADGSVQFHSQGDGLKATKSGSLGFSVGILYKKAQNNKELQIWPERLSDAKNKKGYDRMPGHSLALFARV